MVIPKLFQIWQLHVHQMEIIRSLDLLNLNRLTRAFLGPTYPIEQFGNRAQSNPIEHQSLDCRTQSNIIKLTIKFCQSNTIEHSITEGLVIEPNRTFDYRRKTQKEKEKQEKIQQLKAGDSKDMTVILLREVLLEMGLLFKSSDSKQKLIEKVTLARSSLNSTRTVCAMANSASVIVRHAQQSSDDAAQLAQGINFAGRDSKINTSWQTAFLPDTREQLQVTVTSFLPTTLILILRKKIVLLIVLLFLASMLTKLSSTDIIQCCYAGDCSPRLHVTLGHSGEPGESNGCSEVPSAYYNTNFKHNCLCCCC